MKKILFLGIFILGLSIFELVSFADALDKKPNVESVKTPEIQRDKPIEFISPVQETIQFTPAQMVLEAVSNLEINIIPNPSVEDSVSNMPQNWRKGGYGVNTRALTYPVAGVSGGKAMSVNIASYSSGDAKWYFDDVPVTIGNTYRFSDYYLSDIPSIIDVRFKMSDGTYRYKDIAHVDPNTGPDFKQTIVDFVIPENVVSVTIFHLISNVGFLTTDEYSIVNISTPPPPPPPPIDEKNLLLNPNFEEAGAVGFPLSWKKGGWGTNTRVFTYPITSYDGSKAAKVNITNYSSGDAKWYFTPLSLAPGMYTYSENFSSDVNSVITAQYQDASGKYSYLDIAKFKPTNNSSYQTAVVDFFVSDGIKNVTLFHLIQGVGSLLIDTTSLKLKKELSGVFTTGAVTFRFDDGWVSQYENAIPKLNSYGYKGTFYITSKQLLDNGFRGFFNTNQLKEISTQGHEIGAHTRTHADLANLTPSQQLSEIQGSRNDLIAMGLGSVNSFSYPFGNYTTSTIQIVKDAGFSHAASVINGYVNPVSDRYQLERREIIVTTTIDEIKTMIDTALAEKKWLIFEIHEVNNSGNLYSTTKEIFDQTVEYVRLKGIPVVTIDEGAKSLR